MSEHHGLWRLCRRPFRYPSCNACVYELYDAGAAGCLKCGRAHVCAGNSVDNKCPLVLCDDGSRVCEITGCVLSEVRHAKDEFMDTVQVSDGAPVITEIDSEVHSVVWNMLQGPSAARCRRDENARMTRKLQTSMHKAIKAAKSYTQGLPNMHHVVAAVAQAEKNLRFYQEASTDLTKHCSQCITVCLLGLRSKGFRAATGVHLKSLVVGLLILLRSGISFHSHVILPAVPEISSCLPSESKLEQYFGFSSKVVTSIENECKLFLRGVYQQY